MKQRITINRKALNTSLLIAVCFLFVTSCSVERRLHNKGFHVEWNKKYKKNKAKDEIKEQNYAQHSEEFLETEINRIANIIDVDVKELIVSNKTHE